MVGVGYLEPNFILLAPPPCPHPSTAQSQTLQTVLLFCLAALALSSTPFADTLEAALASPSGAPSLSTPSSTLAARLRLAFGVAVPGAAVAWAFIGERIMTACARMVWLRKQAMFLNPSPTPSRSRTTRPSSSTS